MDIVGGVKSLGNKALSALQAYGSYQIGDYKSALKHGASVLGGKVEQTVSQVTDMYSQAQSTLGMVGAGYHGFSGAMRAA